MSLSARLRRFIEALPKAELHVHLEGTLTPDFAFDLACRHGHPLADLGPEAIHSFYQHADFHDFLEHLEVLLGLLQHPGDLYDLVGRYTRFARRSNIVYAEVHLTPLPLVVAGMPYPALMRAVEWAVDEARREGLQLQVILDTIRHLGPEPVEETLRLHREHPFPCVVALGLSGDESAAPPEGFEAAFERARKAGLRTVVHSGESGDARSVWETLERLRPERILHGIRAAEDEALLRHLAEAGIPLDVCLSSNLGTRVVANLEQHPIRRLFDAGVRITLNTDDPPLFGTNLNREYLLLAEQLDFSAEELFRVAGEGFRAAFLDEAQRDAYLQSQERLWQAFQAGATPGSAS